MEYLFPVMHTGPDAGDAAPVRAGNLRDGGGGGDDGGGGGGINGDPGASVASRDEEGRNGGRDQVAHQPQQARAHAPGPAPVTGYCYLCATVSSDENVFRKWIQDLVDRGSSMPLRQLCGLVLEAYTDYVKNVGPVPRPDWTLETIMEHMYDHQPTARFVLKQSVVTANALIKAHIRVAHRVREDGVSVPCHVESRMIMNLMTGRAKLVQQYETACLAASTRK